ncbi:MAG: two-component sensor histidine kinase, partial [Actinomycetia bacterium]|nr:two-component sensor histidine kinase [Actinomycetes bacterium]
KLRRLLDELFELSRVGIQANPPEEVAFGDLVREARLQLAGQVAERGV